MDEIESATSVLSSRHPSAATVSSPLPTDSMVTVGLPDPPVASPSISPLQAEDHVALSAEEDSETQKETSSLHMDTIANTNENAVSTNRGLRDDDRISTFSLNSVVEEEQSICTSHTIRSRSNTSGSFSSNGSAQVDWDELEKSEEQAPRDEGSDEVCPLPPIISLCSSNIGTVDRIPTRQTRAREQCFGNRSKGHTRESKINSE